MIYLALSSALAIGLILGLLGGGGAILTVPALIYLMGLETKVAIASSLLVVGLTSLIGAIRHWQKGTLEVQTGLRFGAIAMLGSMAGSQIAQFLPDWLQMLLFSLVILTASFLMMFKKSPAAPSEKIASQGRLLSTGFGVGLLTGIVGVGGGFLIVPALLLLAAIPMHRAVGTSLLTISMTALAGMVGYMGHVTLPWTLIVGFTGFTIAGMLIGSSLLPFIPAQRLRQSFAGLLALVGTWVLAQQLTQIAI